SAQWSNACNRRTGPRCAVPRHAVLLARTAGRRGPHRRVVRARRLRPDPVRDHRGRAGDHRHRDRAAAAARLLAGRGVGAVRRPGSGPAAGARLRPLPVAGAFHTTYMAPAVAALAQAAGEVDVSDPAMALLSNADGAVVAAGADWLKRIIHQVSAPVRWDECMRSMSTLG